MKALRRAVAFVRAHAHWPSKKTDEEVAEKIVEGAAIGATVRLVGMLAAAGTASAAVAVFATQTSPTYHPSFSLSLKGAAFITRNEGVRYHPYNDPSGKPICTVGVGHVIAYRGCTSAELRETYTAGQVTALLMHDVSWASNCVREKITHPIVQPQFDSLVDLTFNAGCGSLDYSGIAVMVDHGDLASVPSRLAVTAVTAGGIYLPGLKTRRLAEGVLFARGFYGAGIGFYLPPKPVRGPDTGRCGGIEWPRRPAHAYRTIGCR